MIPRGYVIGMVVVIMVRPSGLLALAPLTYWKTYGALFFSLNL